MLPCPQLGEGSLGHGVAHRELEGARTPGSKEAGLAPPVQRDASTLAVRTEKQQQNRRTRLNTSSWEGAALTRGGAAEPPPLRYSWDTRSKAT